MHAYYTLLPPTLAAPLATNTPYQAIDHAPDLGPLRLLGHRNLVLLEHAPATVGAMGCNRRCRGLSGTVKCNRRHHGMQP